MPWHVDLAGKRLLVIGGAGLIGSHTVDELLLEDVQEVRVFDNFTRGSEANLQTALRDPRVVVFDAGGDITQTDILDAAMADIDGVFHLAALWLLQCHEYPRAAFDVNVRGTFNVLEACVRHPVKRLVYSSSASVYGDAVSEPMTEDHPFANRNFYGATKICGEAMCRALYDRYADEPQRFEYVGLRYMNVYGPRQDYLGAYISVIMKMLDRLDRGQRPLVYGDGSQAYDFIYVGDCARANVLAMKADCTDEFYNVGGGTRTTIKTLAELLIEMTGADVAIEYHQEGTTFVKNRIGSTEKAAADLGFETQVGLRDGLRRLIEWRSEHQERCRS